MFVFSVPDTGDRDKRRRDSTLCKTEQEADGSKAGEGLRCGEAHADDTPDHSARRNILVKLVKRTLPRETALEDLHCDTDKLGQV